MQDHAPPMRSPSSYLEPGSQISRRRFGQQAALAATAVFTSASLASAHDAARQATESGLATSPSQEVEAKLANIVRKYGDRLTQEQRTHLRHILTYNEKMLASVRAFPLKNQDAPASVLKVSAVEEGKP
jgi:hypothetical protein